MLLRSNIASIKGHTLWLHFMAMEECGIHLIYASCFKCQRNEEYQQKLCLKGHAINELPIIECPLELDSLCLRECKNLESLPSTICELKSLTTLSCPGCSQLKTFPAILETWENLRTAIEELPSSIQHIRGLRYLNLAYCNNLEFKCGSCWNKAIIIIIPGNNGIPGWISEQKKGSQITIKLPIDCNLVNLPESICNLRFLKYLNVNLCSKLEKFPDNLGSLQCLEGLEAAGFDSNQVLRAIHSDVCYMSPCKALNLSINYFSSIPARINQLSNLRILDLSHCHKLLQIPELPPSLRGLDVHVCPCLETLLSPSSLLGFSLFKCFKSAIEV
ncbi:Disease resistance-like protein CSA1 [Vitis vinifera]|uniref:Disease resistance-like protein CSA1 n=1 Tax=Vitis vinifera TaxID=29760 RepID=A0A438GWZ1_VITVI|nr:Disease resistance-like protein CSA1 [Vitis vinifera]